MSAGKDRGDRGPSGKQFFMSQEAAGRIEVSIQRDLPVNSLWTCGAGQPLPALSRLCASQWLPPTMLPTIAAFHQPGHCTCPQQLRLSRLHLRYPTAEQLHSLSTAMVLLQIKGAQQGATELLQAIAFSRQQAMSQPTQQLHVTPAAAMFPAGGGGRGGGHR